MDYISKTQKKKEARDLQKLGERLVNLSLVQIADIEMPEEIYNAVISARTIKSHVALKRQMQFLGTLMRRIDPGTIQEAIDDIDRGSSKKASEFKEIEMWRDELMNGNKELMEEILIKYPDADRQQMAQLVRNAVKEKSNNRPPKASRALFRYLTNARDKK